MAMKNDGASPAELLQNLENRHEKLIARLDELNEQIEAALHEVASTSADD